MSQPEDAKAAPAPPAAGQELVLEPIAPAVVPAPAVPAPARKPQDQPGHPGTAVDPLIVPQSAQFGCLPLEPYALPNPDGDPNYFAKKAGELQVQPNQPDPATVEMHDVLVVGGGLSGLTCAFRVLDSAAHELGLKGNELPKVAVLESAAKLGGRTRSSDPHLWDIKDKIDANAGHISYGGTWVMFDNHELLSLSWDLDHLPFQPKLFPNFTTYALNWRLLVLHPYLIIKLRTLGSRIYNAKDPNSAEFQELKKLDTIPVEQWLAENAKGLPFPDHAKQAVRDWCYQGENFPTQPEHLWFMSTWFLARMIYVRLSHFAQTGTIFSKVMRWENGTGEVVDRLAKKIRDLGGYCYTEQRVDSCVTKGDHVEVTVTRREGEVQKQAVYRARRVVMAGAPHASTRITYEPPLPQNYIDFGDSMRLWDDVGTQVVLVWSTRWWDKKWKSAVMLPPPDDEQQGVYGACMDLSDHGPAAVHNYLDVNKHPLPTGIGVLRILVKSSRLKNPDGSMWDTDRVRDSAFAYLIKEGRLAKNLEEMGKGFLKCWVWNHEWNPDTLGTAFFAPPTLNARYASSVPACDKPWGHFHFAGSERARRGTQWMDGAVYAGQHKAPEVLESLYPGRYRHNQERQAYKARILKSEEQAIALLRKTLPHHKFLYFFEMVLRWAAGNIANIWHNLVELSHEHWKDLAPKLPDGAKFELFTQASAEHGAVLREGDHLFSHNGRFRLGLTDHGTVILLHMRLNEAPGEVWQSDKPEHKKLSPYKLVLQPDGDLQLFSDNPHHASDTFVWHSHSACPKGLYASFRLLLGDDRGLNVYGYYPNGSRQIIWSAHTSDIHFSRPTLRQESIDRHDQLVHLHATLHKSKPVGFRRPEPGEEQRILDDMFKQQVKEKSYGQLMCHAVVDVEHRRSHKMEMHFMTEGQELREGQGLLSPHESHRIHVENGDLVITHKKTHGFHPISPWEEVPKWRAGVTGKNARLVLTHEGQLQLFHGPTLAWSSPKPAKPRSPFQFHIHDDCNAALYNSRLKPVWSTETACAPDVPFGEGEQDE